MNQKVRFLSQAAVIAALYVVLTWAAASLGLASPAIQVRFSEALTILPFFTPAAVPGLFLGCLLANLLTGSALPDVLFGSIATLLGAVGTYLLSRPLRSGSCSGSRTGAWRKWLAPLPPIVSNTLIVPFILAYVYRFEGSILYFMATVGIGEIISCGVLGLLLLQLLTRYRKYIFPDGQ